MSARYTIWGWALLGLLAFFGLHLIAINSVPPFIDEAYHIGLIQSMTETSPLYGTGEGRLFSTWYWALFAPQVNGSFWVLRATTVLAMVLAAASVIGIGRLAAGTWGAVFAFLLYLFSPLNTFYNTIGLSDPLGASLVLAALYFTFRLRVRVALLDAAVVGVFLFLAAGAKIAYLPYAVVPILGVLTLSRASWRARGVWAGAALIVFGGLFGTLLGVLAWRDYNILGHLVRGAAVEGEAEAGTMLLVLLQRMAGRTGAIGSQYVHYVGWIGGSVGIVALVAHLWQRRFFLPMVLFVPGLAVWASSVYFTRYLYLHMALMMLIAGITLRVWARSRIGRVIVGALVLAFGALVWLPFYVTLLTNPVELPLTDGEYMEYFTADSSGAGLAEIEAFLVAEGAERVIGLLPNCLSLKYSALDTLTVECPRVNPNGEDIPVLRELVSNSRAPGVMVVKENSPYVPQDIPGEIIYQVERPTGRSTLTVYDLSP